MDKLLHACAPLVMAGWLLCKALRDRRLVSSRNTKPHSSQCVKRWTESVDRQKETARQRETVSECVSESAGGCVHVTTETET
jgi:hypothetical protein